MQPSPDAISSEGPAGLFDENQITTSQNIGKGKGASHWKEKNY